MKVPGALSSIAARAGPATAFSPEFDWLAYLDYNPDVEAYKFTSETLVKRHYQWMGEAEKRLHQRIPIVVRYSACGGLMNQHYSHLTALVLASALGADVAMPVSLTRDSFASYYSLNPLLNQVSWNPISQDTVYDIDAVSAMLAERGAKLWLVPPEAGQPNFHDQRNAYPTWLPDGFDERQRIRFGGGQESRLYLQAAPLEDIVNDVTATVIRHARDLFTAHNLAHPPTILLDLPCTLFGINMCSPSAESLAGGIAQRLLFSGHLQRLADKVVAGMGQRFNGLHLRLEKDAKDWAMMSGGVEALEKMYWSACDNNGFDQGTAMYLASGLLSYNDTEKMNSVTEEIRKFSKSLHYKEMYLSPEDLADFSVDQLSAIDFLVLTRAERFVGIGSSTFSWFIREYRALLGYHEHTSLFVHTQHIGTDPLFNKGAKLPRTDRIFRGASIYP